ncbi:MAG: metalloregulator ArsR/SmtB family transcription factor [Desulfitobacterium hafniense]|nr:metalloregulator ArsR/SmtB family transcription factor [Desulfitobacterium hafniense]
MSSQDKQPQLGSKNRVSKRCNDSCEVFVFDPEKVDKLKEEVGLTEGLGQIFKVLADDTRLKVIYALCMEEELCVCDVAQIIRASTAVASHHLRLLRNMKLAKFRREGKMAFYSLQSRHVRYLILEALNILGKDDDHEF